MAQVYSSLGNTNAEDNYDFAKDSQTKYSTDALEGAYFVGNVDEEDLGGESGWSDEDAAPAQPAKWRVADLNTNNDTIAMAARGAVPALGYASMTRKIESHAAFTGRAPTQHSLKTGTLFTQILELFPDISLAYVEELIDRHGGNVARPGPTATQEDLLMLQLTIREMVVEEILANPSYPTRKQLKRKRDEASQPEDSDKKWETATHDGDHMYQTAA